MFSFSPFEQFEMNGLYITNSTVYMLYAILVYMLVYNLNITNSELVPGSWQSVIELTYTQIVNMVLDNIGNGKYTPFIWTIFTNLSIMNLMGMVPYTFTPTAHIMIGFGLSLSILIGVTLLGFDNFGADFMAIMMPAGSPLILAPLLVAMELVSQLAKGVSLGVRLAANITAGHLLFAILSGFTWSLIAASSLLFIFPLLMVIFITMLEMAVALMQAYVFSILTTIYINESVHLH